MMSFFNVHSEMLPFLLAAALLAWRLSLYFYRSRQIDEGGTDTDGVITRIEESYDAGQALISYEVYVGWHDENGFYRESRLSRKLLHHYEEGQQLRIRYLPGRYDLVREVSR